MTTENRQTVYPSRYATEQHIAAIINERKALSGELYNDIDEQFGSEFGHMMFQHLGELLDILRDDLKHFDAIDAAMEQAVK